jgi:hypothetical protein
MGHYTSRRALTGCGSDHSDAAGASCRNSYRCQATCSRGCGATPEELHSGRYEPRPFSLASSVMIDDLTSQRFPALAPIFPSGKEYAPAEILTYLSPGRSEVLTLQFKVPSSALIADAGTSKKQTVSLLLTGKGSNDRSSDTLCGCQGILVPRQ